MACFYIENQLESFDVIMELALHYTHMQDITTDKTSRIMVKRYGFSSTSKPKSQDFIKLFGVNPAEVQTLDNMQAYVKLQEKPPNLNASIKF